ncbi:transposase [Acetobacter vaccinii]|uniref:Transposase n=1 Tax=Acetobacter vaccinii TaxID=2592655 RepID=A0A5C1YSV5_9PROT|nr:transposase [Acetobacter vaccinii]
MKDILPGREGSPWRDPPVRFGSWKNVHRQLRPWCEGALSNGIFRYLAVDHDNAYMAIDSTIV